MRKKGRLGIRRTISIVFLVFCAMLTVFCEEGEEKAPTKHQPLFEIRLEMQSAPDKIEIKTTQGGTESTVSVQMNTQGERLENQFSIQESTDPDKGKAVTTLAPEQNSCEAPPTPPDAETQDLFSFLKYYCIAWINENYCVMYGALAAKLQIVMSYDQFKERYLSDAERTGGLSGVLLLDSGSVQGNTLRCKLELHFINERIKPRVVTCALEKTKKGFRLLESGLIPLDLDDM